jgi:hypothetical protein
MKTFLVSFQLALSVLVPSTAPAQTEAPRPYVLKAGSTFSTGCFGPCACPVVQQPMQGTFQLLKTGVDPLFTDYSVLDVRWALPNEPKNVTITGSGTYRVGGEFAVQHQMTLDLSVAGGPVQHFDSGLILGGGTFPDIDISLSLHRDQACVDTLLHVLATPATATSAENADASVTPGIRTVTPSPFRDRVGFVVSMTRGDQVRVAVYDARGRMVRELVAGTWEAGEHPIVWDGRAESGERCGSGLYLISAAIGAERFATRVIRVR